MANDSKASLLTRFKFWPFHRKREFAELNASKSPSADPYRSPSAVSPIDNNYSNTPATLTPALSEVVDAPSKRLKYTTHYTERDALLSIPTAALHIPRWSKSSKSASSMPARFEYDFDGSAPAAFMHPNSHISLERRSHRGWRGSDDWNAPSSAQGGYGCSKSFSAGGGGSRNDSHSLGRRHHPSSAYESTPHLRSRARKSSIPDVPALPNVCGSEPDLDDTPTPAAVARRRNKCFSAWRASHYAQQGDEEEDRRLAWEMAGVFLADEEFEEGYEDFGKDYHIPPATVDGVPPWSSVGLLPQRSSRAVSSAKMGSSSSVAGELHSGSAGKAVPSLQKVVAARNFSRPDSPSTASSVRPSTPVRGRLVNKGKGRASDFLSPIERLRSESPSFGPPSSPPPTKALPAVPTSPETAIDRPGSRRGKKVQSAQQPAQPGPSTRATPVPSQTSRIPLDSDTIDFALPPPPPSPPLPKPHERNQINQDAFSEEERICSRLSGLGFDSFQTGHEPMHNSQEDEEPAVASGASADGMDSEDRREEISTWHVMRPGCRSPPVVIRDADNGMGGWF